MDWEEINKFTQDYLDKKFKSIAKALESNKIQILELLKITDALEKHYKLKSALPLAKPSRIPRSKSPPELKSPGKLRPPSDIKHNEDLKKHTQDTKSHEDLKKLNPDPKHPEDSKKPKNKDEEKKKKEIPKKKEEDKAKDEDEKRLIIKKDSKKDVKRKSIDANPDKPKKKEDSKIETKGSKSNLLKPDEIKVSGRSPARPSTESKLPKKSPTKPAEPKSAENNDAVAGKLDEKDDIDNKIVEKPLISLTPSPKVYTKPELELILSALTPITPLKSQENFIPSIGLQVSLHTLSKLGKSGFYLDTNKPSIEFLWAIKVIWGFKGHLLQNNEEIWEEAKKFIVNEKNNRINPDIGNSFIELTNSFDFNDDNLDYIEGLVSGIDLDSKKFSEKCKASGILILLIKEVALFGGILLPDGPPWRVYKRYSHKLSQTA